MTYRYCSAGACSAFSFGLAGGLTITSWLWYEVTAAWLAARRLLPRRLMSFLDDTHRRGVLRQAGAGYQFRHALLQDRLAEPASADETARSAVTTYL